MKYAVPSELLPARERGRGAEQHRRVAVVAAGVHLARHLRCVRDAGFLGDVKRVEVGAQADRIAAVGAAAGAMAKDADDARAGETGVNLESERGELVGDERARDRLLERGFRMRMDLVPPGLHFRDQRRNFRDELHRRISSAGTSGGESRRRPRVIDPSLTSCARGGGARTTAVK